MMSWAADIDIDRALDEVFAFVLDFRNNPQWQPVDRVEKLTPGEIGPGTVFRQALRVLGRAHSVEFHLVELEPERRLAFRGQSPALTAEAAYVFEPVVFGMRLRAQGQVLLAGRPRLLQPLFAAQLRREMGANFEKLKQVLEAQPTEAPGRKTPRGPAQDSGEA